LINSKRGEKQQYNNSNNKNKKKRSKRMKQCQFYYDVVCPYAYLASKQIEGVAKRTNTQLIWKPVLLGGIYAATQAPQGKAGSASDVMSQNKRLLMSQDLVWQAERRSIPLHFHPQHPVKSLYALRLLLSTPESIRPSLTHALFDAYWVQNQDISSPKVLQDIAQTLFPSAFNDKKIEETLEDLQAKELLATYTAEAVQRGACGVPSFWVDLGGSNAQTGPTARLFWGQDRLHFVEWMLSQPANTRPPCLRLFPTPPTPSSTPTLRFIHDFSSPWSFLGSTKIESFARENNARLIYHPILLGALFKEIGTTNVPLLAMSEAKRRYFSQDLQDWIKWWGDIPNFGWPSSFPLRTVAALRLSIVEPRLIHLIYAAAWTKDRNIGDVAVLKEIMTNAGFDAEKLLEESNQQAVKDQLKDNTLQAQTMGACGVPTFIVNDQYIVWGQDRLDVVADLLAGWKPKVTMIDVSEFSKRNQLQSSL